MYKTTREFSSLLKDIIGVPVEKECWYLVVYLYACFGINLSLENPAKTIFNRKHKWKRVYTKQFMDLLLFGKEHVGVVLDDKYFIHADNTVKIEKYKGNILLIPGVKVYRLCH